MKLKSLYGLLIISCLTACDSSSKEHAISDPEATHEKVQDLALDEAQTQFRKTLFENIGKYELANQKDPMKSFLGQSLIMVGRQDIVFNDGLLKVPTNRCTASDETLNPISLERLDKLIGDNTLVIINEDHNQPRHRDFVSDLLDVFQTKGFTYFAAETFTPEIALNNSPYTSIGDGFYTNDPSFGRLVSKAKALGFKLIPYEQTEEQSAPETASIDERIAARENAQSENLIRAVLSENPKAKMLIYVGHSHVAEKPIINRRTGKERRWMASYLKEKLGIDPVTISQTACGNDGSRPFFGDGFVTSEGELGHMVTDFVIGHDKITYKYSRPERWGLDGYGYSNIPDIFLDLEMPILLEVRNFDQSDRAVPIDRVLIKENERDIRLFIPNGKYRIEAFDKTGQLVLSHIEDVKVLN